MQKADIAIYCQFSYYCRPLVMTGLCILILYLLYGHYFGNSIAEPGENNPPNHHKNVEHILMQESDLEEMDETEHLYLEQ